MHLRPTFVIAAVAVAAVAASWRATHAAPPPPPFAMDAAHGTVDTRAPSRARATNAAGPPDAKIVVYVAGEVRRSGLYRLATTARAADALAAAGGPTAHADLVAVDLAQTLSDGDEVAVPALDAAPARTRATKRTTTAHHKKHRRKRHHRPSAGDTQGVENGAAETPVEHRVDLNTADESDLETLPGVGATLAERIVAFREVSGPFATTDDLLDVAGMTPAKLDALAPYVATGGAVSAAAPNSP